MSENASLLRHVEGRTDPDALLEGFLAWTAEQPGISSVLFGATTPAQAVTNAAGLRATLDDEARRAIACGITKRGPVAGRRPV